ncbi:MAG: hypothetical protein ACFFD1_00135 [Candidatus Thorarchaeota archaeon]
MGGLFPIDLNSSGDIEAAIDADDSTALGVGDPVVLDTTTGMVQVNTGMPYRTALNAATAGDTNAIFGVITAINSNSIEGSGHSLTNTYRPASTACYVSIRRAKAGERFRTTPTAAMSATDIGSVANLNAVGANTSTGISNAKLDQSSLATSGNTTYQLKVVGFVDDVTKTLGTDIIDPIVEINNIQADAGSAGE